MPKLYVKTCSICGSVFINRNTRQRFCSRQCSGVYRTANYKVSEETKEKMRQAKLDRPVRYWKGKARPEHIEIMRQTRLKQRPPQAMTDIEKALYDQFKKRRLKFEMHKSMFGRWQPDFVFEKAKLIVQADGDYWHDKPEVKERDQKFNDIAELNEWSVMRFSGTAIKKDAAACARAVVQFIRKK